MLQPGIFFHFTVAPFYFPHRNRLKMFLHRQMKGEEGPIEALHYIFCSDEFLHRMNQDYLGHDTYTDIITFPLSRKGQPLVADIYISIDRVRDNSTNLQTRFLQELHRVVFHGALHLCGYKDKTAREVETMRCMEDRWLDKFFRST